MSRFLIPVLALLLLVLAIAAAAATGATTWILVAVVAAVVLALGGYDLLQRRHSILRNYPVLGHMRFLLEKVRPELQQYFIERDYDGRPYDRDTPHLDLRAGQGHQGGEGVRHRTGRQRGRLRVAPAHHRAAEPPGGATAGQDRWPALHPAVRHGALERERDELRCPFRCRPDGAQPGRGRGWVRARHGGGRPHRPPSPRWRRGLGARLGVLRCPYGLGPHHVIRRHDAVHSASYPELYEWLEPGELLSHPPDGWSLDWAQADPDSFTPRTPL